jgi:hypothetical protein
MLRNHMPHQSGNNAPQQHAMCVSLTHPPTNPPPSTIPTLPISALCTYCHVVSDHVRPTCYPQLYPSPSTVSFFNCHKPSIPGAVYPPSFSIPLTPYSRACCCRPCQHCPHVSQLTQTLTSFKQKGLSHSRSHAPPPNPSLFPPPPFHSPACCCRPCQSCPHVCRT